MRNANQIFRGFLKIDRIKEKFVFVSRRWFSFSLFIFVDSFSITWTALLKMVFPITVMENFSIDGTFTTVVRIFGKLAFFDCLCSLSGDFTSRFWVFRNLVQVDGVIWLKKLSRHVYEFLQQHDQQLLLWEESIQIHEEDALSMNYHSCHKQSCPLLKSHGKFQIHILN